MQQNNTTSLGILPCIPSVLLNSFHFYLPAYFITRLYISQRWQPIQLHGMVAKWNVMDRYLVPREKWVGHPQSILWKHSWGADRHFLSWNQRIYYRWTSRFRHTTKTSFVTKQADWSIHQKAQEKLNPDIWRPLAPLLWFWYELLWVTNCFYFAFKRVAIFGLKLGLPHPWHLKKGQRLFVINKNGMAWTARKTQDRLWFWSEASVEIRVTTPFMCVQKWSAVVLNQRCPNTKVGDNWFGQCWAKWVTLKK